MRKLVACLACRNNGSRLYGKPLQNLDIQNQISVLDYMLESIQSYSSISETVLAISEGSDNNIFIEIAKRHKIKYYIGPQDDVLQRLIKSAEVANATDIFRLTTESPFTYFEAIDKAWLDHKKDKNDLTALDNLPDGSGFEIIALNAYRQSWEEGGDAHRSEYCSLYIRENKNKFKVAFVDIPDYLRRIDVRLTIDYPEDLVVCRKIYENFKEFSPNIPLSKIIEFWDTQPEFKGLVGQYVDEGLKTMYL